MGLPKLHREDYVQQQGWVLIAFRNALWQLLNAPSLEAGVVDTVMPGGDTDTNAALWGRYWARCTAWSAIPAQWVDRVLNWQPQGRTSRRQPPGDQSASGRWMLWNWLKG